MVKRIFEYHDIPVPTYHLHPTELDVDFCVDEIRIGPHMKLTFQFMAALSNSNNSHILRASEGSNKNI